MIKGTHWKFLSPSEFKTIKYLLNEGKPIKKVAEVYDRSYSTVSIIKRSDTFDDYLKVIRKYNENKQTPVKEPVTTPPMDSIDDYIPEPAPVYSSDMQELIHEIRKLRLEVGRLVGAWEARPEKKGIFG